MALDFQRLLAEGHKPTWHEEHQALPAGKTCGSCFNFLFCSGIGIAAKDQVLCDYYPVRYREAAN